MATISKTMTILAVHGETSREVAQRVLDEKSSRAPDHEKIAMGHKFDHERGPFLPKSDFPMAECHVMVVATDDDAHSRLELRVANFDEAAGLMIGDKITVVVTA